MTTPDYTNINDLDAADRVVQPARAPHAPKKRWRLIGVIALATATAIGGVIGWHYFGDSQGRKKVEAHRSELNHAPGEVTDEMREMYIKIADSIPDAE